MASGTIPLFLSTLSAMSLTLNILSRTLFIHFPVQYPTKLFRFTSLFCYTAIGCIRNFFFLKLVSRKYELKCLQRLFAFSLILRCTIQVFFASTYVFNTYRTVLWKLHLITFYCNNFQVLIVLYYIGTVWKQIVIRANTRLYITLFRLLKTVTELYLPIYIYIYCNINWYRLSHCNVQKSIELTFDQYVFY